MDFDEIQLPMTPQEEFEQLQQRHRRADRRFWWIFWPVVGLLLCGALWNLWRVSGLDAARAGHARARPR